MRRLHTVREVFPIRGVFRISRGARTESVVVTATVTEGEATGVTVGVTVGMAVTRNDPPFDKSSSDSEVFPDEAEG